MTKGVNMKRFLILLAIFYVGCENPTGSGEVIEHEFRVFSETLHKDDNLYYHMTLNPNTNQSFSTLTAYTSSDWIQKVGWYTDTTWIYTHFNGEDFEVPLVNGVAYTDVDGEAHTVFAPIYEMLGDTVKVYAEYVDENTNLLYTSWISIVLD